MKNKIQFDFNRLILMLKHDGAKYWKKMLTIIGGSFIAGTLFAVFFVITGDNHLVANEMHTILFPMVLFFVGIFLVSLSFRDLNNDTERIFYLGMPASHVEKYISRFIITGILLPLFISVIYSIYALFYDTIILMFLDEEINRFSFFTNTFESYNPTSFDFLKFYLPLHSVFFLGAITFRKLAFFKTLFSGWLVVAIFAGISYLLAKILMPELFNGGVFLDNPTVQPSEWFQDFFETYIDDVLYIIGLIIIPIICWIVSYFKLTEKEA